MDKWLHKCRFSICKNDKEVETEYFNQIQVCETPDAEVEIDFDCTQGKYKDTFVNVSMNAEEAELLVFRLQQVIKKTKEK